MRTFCSSALLQHVTDLGDVLGAEDLASQKHIAALTLAFKSFRCFYLAESYVTMKKWPEAIGLFDRAVEHVMQSLEQYRSLEQGAGGGAVKVDKEKVSLTYVHVHVYIHVCTCTCIHTCMYM